MTAATDTIVPHPAGHWRSLPAWNGWRSPSWALYVLIVLVLAGIVLRVFASLAGWPTLPTLADSWPYSNYAANNIFANPQHPPGYSLFLATFGLITRSVGVFIVLQHLIGIATALLLFAAIRRMCGSPWPGVIAAAVVLLDADVLFLEDQIMSETLFTLLMAATLYATARVLEGPDRWWPWPILLGVFSVLMTMSRTAGIFLIPVILLALLFAGPRPWRPRLPTLAAYVIIVVALFFVQAGVSSLTGNPFGITPSPGWHLYARAAPIADCTQFTPPPGTRPLCEETAMEVRGGPDHYLYDDDSPALREFGTMGVEDSKLKEFGEQVVLHQPRAFLESVWPDIWAYFFPDSYGQRTSGHGTDIDGQLAWLWANNEDEVQQQTQEGMETFFTPFHVHRRHRLIDAFYHYQRIVRFGGTMLTISTLLILIGLFVGTRRRRIAVFVLGIGGLAILVLPMFSANYIGRYMVPPAGLYAAAAVIAAMSIVSSLRSRRRGSGAASAAP